MHWHMSSDGIAFQCQLSQDLIGTFDSNLGFKMIVSKDPETASYGTASLAKYLSLKASASLNHPTLTDLT